MIIILHQHIRMGNICSCDESGARDSIQANILQEEALKRKDPIIQELYQHLRLINQKLENNLSSIDDFSHLLIFSKKEIHQKQKDSKNQKQANEAESLITQQLKEVLTKIESIESGFEDAKQSIKSVAGKNKSIRQMLDQLEKDLNQL